MRIFKSTLCTLLIGVAASAVFAAESLFDFGVSDGGWKSNYKQYVSKRSTEYPVTGKQGLLFSGAQWDGKKSIWPSFETCSVPARDWSKYDRLVVTVFNDSSASMIFSVIVSDTKEFRKKSVHFYNAIPPYTSKQLVLPVKKAFAENGIDQKNVSFLHCYTENPPDKLRFFVGDFTLLEPGEPVPELPQSYLRKIRNRQKAILSPMLKRWEREAAEFDFKSLPREDADRLRKHIDSQFARFREPSEVGLLLLTRNAAPKEWESVRCLVPAMAGFAALRKDVTALPGYEDVLLGYATPMEKILPRAPIFRPLQKAIEIEAAQNEQEAAQLIVMPFEKDRKQVGVRLTDFTGPAGTLPKSALSAVPVGFVETTFIPPYGSEYVGFWSDPLLAFLDAVDVKAGETQPFWIKARIPAGQPAGVYTGKAEVVIEGKTAFAVPVSVRVRDFALPNHSMLPLAVTFWPGAARLENSNPDFDPEARRSPSAPWHAWMQHKKEWSDLLAGYYLSIDSLYEYSNWEPELELLAELDQQGKLGKFNLGGFDFASDNPENNYGMQSTIDRIRSRYEKAKRLGLLEHAYIYGCDEATADKLPMAQRAAAILKKEFPDVPIFTTAYDESYGMDGRMGAFDWFCPLTPKFNAEQAAAARKAGRQVWWYICMFPHEPYANNFIESPAIEIRLLMGAMSMKYRPDGFLYYQTGIWNNPSPITTGPYTDWIAESYPSHNGDGNWTYPGPDSTPLESIRLENFRDGLEDYAYGKILEQRLAAAKQAGKDLPWQKEAEAALAVPASLVESLTEYTHDPQKAYAWRSRLAELIEGAPVK